MKEMLISVALFSLGLSVAIIIIVAIIVACLMVLSIL